MELQIFNIVLFTSMALINAYWTWQNRKVQNDRDIIRSLQNQIAQKDIVIDRMVQKKNAIKLQFEHQQIYIKKLEGKLSIYKKLHGHTDEVDYEEKKVIE